MEPQMRCQAKWEGIHCNGDGISRLISKPIGSFSLAGMMMKTSCSEYFICDDCWPKVKPILMAMNDHKES